MATGDCDPDRWMADVVDTFCGGEDFILFPGLSNGAGKLPAVERPSRLGQRETTGLGRSSRVRLCMKHEKVRLRTREKQRSGCDWSQRRVRR